jgi:Fic family protein
MAPGRTKDETQMILNHKRALEFSEEKRDLFAGKISKPLILELHKILAENLIDSGLRERLVGITGSVYRPLDNMHQINEEIERLCEAINSKEDVFEKALISFIYICYLQPFSDGNKRTARILANAILNANNSFPLSLRAVDVNTYKLAILAYYELGSLGNAKSVFIDQAKYAAENYAI